MGITGWHCEECGQDDHALPRHHFHLRPDTLQYVAMILAEDQDDVPWGWVTDLGCAADPI
jgi:hypothetical protein